VTVSVPVEHKCGPYTLVADGGTAQELPDGTIVLRAERRYLVRSRAGVDPLPLPSVMEPLPGGEGTLLRFGNFVGASSLGGRHLRVTSDRISEAEVEDMLADVAAAGAILPLHRDSPTETSAARDLLSGADPPYLAWLHVAEAIQRRRSHDLPGAMERILARPHRRLARVVGEVPLDRCDDLGSATLVALAARPERLVPLHPDNPLAAAPMARALGGRLPSTVRADRVLETTDTPENRFVVLGLVLATQVVRRIEAAVGRPPRPPRWRRTAAEAQEVIELLARWRSHPSLQDVPLGHGLIPHSTVLRGRSGYREFAAFVRDLLSRSRWAPPEDARQLVDARDAAASYEYWCLVQVLRSLEHATGWRPEPLPLTADDFAAHVPRGAVKVGPITVWYNKTYSPALGTSYSLPLRPDISVFAPESGMHLLDAKLRRDVLLGPAASDSGEDEEGDAVRRGDLYKMHTYRDAIDGARSVWVLYPGGSSESSFYADPEAGGMPGPCGIGAVPLRPGNPLSRRLLDDLMREIASA
jgi:uncharacterized protein DUF2357/PD-(D/E)XK nuclease superfamily protein